MAAIIHPLMPAVNEFPYYSFHDLIWIVHDKFHSKNEHYEKCVVCKNSRYYALDCLKEKWDHDKCDVVAMNLIKNFQNII